MSPASAGRFLTTAPPGKSHYHYFWLTVLEALVDPLRNDEKTSIKIGKEEIKLSLFYLLRKTNGINRVLRPIRELSKVAGFRINF